MRKIKKIFLIFIITFLIVNIFNVALAKDPDSSDGQNGKVTTINPDQYKPKDLKKEDTEGALSKVGVVLGAVRNISVAVSVIGLTVIGIKYIFASVEEKANYKATIWPYIIGFVFAIAGTTLVNFIYKSVH